MKLFLLQLGFCIAFSSVSLTAVKHSHSSANDNTKNVKVGKGSGFEKVAKMFSDSLNTTVDPCTDFFEFSCGKWQAQNRIPDDRASYDRWYITEERVTEKLRELLEDPKASNSQAINKAKLFYRACVDSDGLLERRKMVPLLNKFEQFGFWPVVHGERWRSEEFDLTDLLINVAQSRGVGPLTNGFVSFDRKNVSRNLFYLDQGSLGMGFRTRNYFLNNTLYKKQLKAYRRFQTSLIELVATEAGMDISEKVIDEAVQEMLDFETELARIQVPEEQRLNQTRMYNLYRLSDMNRILPNIDWSRAFLWMCEGRDDVSAYLDSDPEVIVREPKFFVDLAKLLQGTEARVLANYILWRYAKAWSMQLDERFDNIKQEYLKEFSGKNKKMDRWKDCVSATKDKLTYATGAMYVRHSFDKQSREVALDMVEDIREAFRQTLAKSDWMDPDTKAYALEKVNAMEPLIGFSDFLLNDTALDAYHKNLTLSPDDSYADAVEKVKSWNQRRSFARLIEPVDRFEFDISAADVNGFYNWVKNALMFPAAILQEPFFDHSFPKAVNYGAIGFVIGHEITHGFDDNGSQFGKDGNLRDWWSPETAQRFVDRKQCIIDQYSGFEVPETNGTMRVNGVLTQGENIADNGGIKQAFAAYQAHIAKVGNQKEARIPGIEQYTPNQVFFMAYAQVWCGISHPQEIIRRLMVDSHSPQRFRVNGVLQNQPEFSNAFGCPIGSQMNPGKEKRCSVW